MRLAVVAFIDCSFEGDVMRLFTLALLVGLVLSQPRPSLPSLVRVEQGLVSCAGVGPGCYGPVTGVVKAYWQFDESGNVTNYREDAVLNDGVVPPVYNREYSTPNVTKEFFLLQQSDVTFKCITQITTYQPFNNRFPLAVWRLDSRCCWLIHHYYRF